MSGPLVFISAGETSGDRLGAGLMRNERDLFGHDTTFIGMGGPLMRAEQPGTLLDMKAVQAAGLIEITPKLIGIVRTFVTLKHLVKEKKPDLAILIDFPDFHLRLASDLKAKGIPVLFYGAPQAWAWRPERAKIIKERVDALAVLFPFEEAWFRRRGINAYFVGHPVFDAEPRWNFRGGKRDFVIGLFPGSREHEVSAILPVQLEAARILKKTSLPFRFRLFSAPGREKQNERLQRDLGFIVEAGKEDDALDLAWCAAGTVTLELACSEIPWILTHRIHPLSYQLVKRKIQVPNLGLPHVILGKKVAPELVQSKCLPLPLLRETVRLYYDERWRSQIREEWRRMKSEVNSAKAMNLTKLAASFLRKESTSR